MQVEGGAEVGGCVAGSLEVTDRREKDLALKEKEKRGVGGRRQQVQGQESGMEGQVLPHLQQRSLVPLPVPLCGNQISVM